MEAIATRRGRGFRKLLLLHRAPLLSHPLIATSAPAAHRLLTDAVTAAPEKGNHGFGFQPAGPVPSVGCRGFSSPFGTFASSGAMPCSNVESMASSLQQQLQAASQSGREISASELLRDSRRIAFGPEYPEASLLGRTVLRGSNVKRIGFATDSRAAAASAPAKLAGEPKEGGAGKGGSLDEPAPPGEKSAETLQAMREAAKKEQELEDRLFAELDAKRARNETVWHPPPGAAPSMLGRLKELGKGAYSTVRWLLSVMASLPSSISGFVSKGPAHWRSSFAYGWKHFKEEMYHYWVGSKLLYVEVGVASELVFKQLHGKELSRREKAQLMRTTADLFRLVPMLVFLVVPFMEFLLPVALRIFPNMLPSTFEDKLKKEEELRKRLALKLDVARFLQDTVAEMAKELQKKQTGASAETAEALYDFMGKVRAGEPVTNTDITRFAPLFNDELTLDNLERVQLQSMLTFVGLQPYGTDGFLKSRLRHHLATIKEDDISIRAEGIDALTDSELRDACRYRGIRALYGEHSRTIMKRNLEEWLDLSTNRNMPASLLLLSRAFTVTQRASKLMEEQIRATLSSLPDEAVEDVGIQLNTAQDAKSKAAELEKKLALVQREKERIAEERIEAKMEEEALKAAEEAETLSKSDLPDAAEGNAALSIASGSQPPSTKGAGHIATAAARAVVKEASAGLGRQSDEEKAVYIAEKREKRMQEIIRALAVLASYSGVSDERHEFMQLVNAQIKAMDAHVSTRGSNSLLFSGGQLKASNPLPEDELITDVSDRVTNILKRMEKELDAADKQMNYSLKILDEDGDGMISSSEMSKAMGFLQRQMGEDELRSLLERLDCSMEDGHIQVEALMRIAQMDTERIEQTGACAGEPPQSNVPLPPPRT